ncbi:MAG: PKD domain-containing protein, partial [Bacteroidetes bacterium]
TLSEGVCFDRDSVRIEVNPTPKAEFISSLTRGCEDLTVSFFQNSGTGISFIWDFGDGSPINNEPDPVHTYTEPGQYVVSFTATGAGGCSVSSNEQVIQVTPRGEAIFESDPVPGTPVVLPDAEVRFTSLSQGATQWFWNFGDGKAASVENPVHYYQEAGTYEVLLVITDEGGCIDTTSTIVVIVEPRLFIPNVFTPNTDGVNDAYLVEYNGKDTYELRIFDRWGRLMFSSTTAGAAWDGITSDDSRAPEGVYYYTLSIGAQNFTGNITLLR